MAKSEKPDDRNPRRRKYTKRNDAESQPVESAKQTVDAPPVPQEEPSVQPQAAQQTQPQAPAPSQPQTTQPQTPAVANGQSNQSQSDQEKSDYESTHAKYERIKRGNLHITDLQKMTVSELHEVCKREGVNEYTGMKKQELIFIYIQQTDF